MMRNLQAVTLAIAVTLGLSGMALAQAGGYGRGGPAPQYDHHDRREAHRPGFDQGFRDGSYVARQDLDHRKPFDPRPRGKYSNMDRGYHRDYGDKQAYRDDYAAGYRAGYESVFHRR